MSSQRGFRSGASCQTNFGAGLTDGEQTGVSLASHAARVASFVHCRTRGCEATCTRFVSFTIPAVVPSGILRDLADLARITLPSNISARRAIEETAPVKLH